MTHSLEQVIDVLRSRLPHFGDPAQAKDQCALATVLVHGFLKFVGYEPRIWSAYYNGIGHYFVVVDGYVLDFTFRQFESESPFPLFVPCDERPKSFQKCGPVLEEDLRDMVQEIKSSVQYAFLLHSLMEP